MKRIIIIFAVLLVFHSAVSVALYQTLSRTTADSSSESPVVETTTPDQRARGGASFTWTRTEKFSVAVPAFAVQYTRWGYVLLGGAAVLVLWRHRRTTQAA